MSSIPFSTVDLQSSEINAIEDIFSTLSKNFEVRYDTKFAYGFGALEIFRNRKTNVGPAINIKNQVQSFDLAFLNIGYSYPGWYSYGLTYEYQTWGITTLKTGLGHVLIKRQTLLDKIYELINPVEISFKDDPDFNKRFFTITDDEPKARSGLSQSFRTVLRSLNVKDFVIEILDNKLTIGNRKVIEVDVALQLVGFMDELSGLQ